MLIIAQLRRHNWDTLPIFLNMKVFCVFSLDTPHRGDSNECIQYIITDGLAKLSNICIIGIINKEQNICSFPNLFQCWLYIGHDGYNAIM